MVETIFVVGLYYEIQTHKKHVEKRTCAFMHYVHNEISRITMILLVSIHVHATIYYSVCMGGVGWDRAVHMHGSDTSNRNGPH